MASRPSRLSEFDIAAALAELPGWKLEGGKLHREYKFADFVTAFAFMTGVALVAQRMDHHPEWFNVWSTVRIDLETHDGAGDDARCTAKRSGMEELASGNSGNEAVRAGDANSKKRSGSLVEPVWAGHHGIARHDDRFSKRIRLG